MTSIRKTIKQAKKNVNAKSITIEFQDKDGHNVKLNHSQNKAKRKALAKILSGQNPKLPWMKMVK